MRSSEVRITFYNYAIGPLYVTGLQVHGQAITVYDPVTLTREDAASQSTYLKRMLTLDLSLSADEVFGEALACYLLDRFKTPFTDVRQVILCIPECRQLSSVQFACSAQRKDGSQMKGLAHTIFSNVFVAFTALAAWLHSAWVFATSFGGNPPSGDGFQVALWYVPGALLAFALDIGLLATSVRLRTRRTKARIVTFFALALFQFYLQFVYLIEHTPAVVLSAGVRQEWQAVIQVIADLRIVIVPLLLPLALILYTAEHDDQPADKPIAVDNKPVNQESALIVSGVVPEDFLAPVGSSNGHNKDAAAIVVRH